MRVIRASRAGFCMGVSLALKKLERAIATRDGRERVCVLGPIIHNPQVLREYEKRGVVWLEKPGDARAGDRVLIRAHGVPKTDEEILRASGAKVEDATCPKVKNAQLAIMNASADGAGLLLFGEAEHPEVRGLVSYATGRTAVFGSPEELEELAPDINRRWALASQTTQDRAVFDALSKTLAARAPNLVILNTICDATSERQEEATRLAREADAMIVVGGRESGNTRRLALLSGQAGKPCFHVERKEELNVARLRGFAKVGLTAGASTPKSLIDEVEEWLAHIN